MRDPLTAGSSNTLRFFIKKKKIKKKLGSRTNCFHLQQVDMPRDVRARNGTAEDDRAWLDLILFKLKCL